MEENLLEEDLSAAACHSSALLKIKHPLIPRGLFDAVSLRPPPPSSRCPPVLRFGVLQPSATTGRLGQPVTAALQTLAVSHSSPLILISLRGRSLSVANTGTSWEVGRKPGQVVICCKAEFKALIRRNSRRELDLDFKVLSGSHLLPQCLETLFLRFSIGSKFCPQLNTGPQNLGVWPDPSIANHYSSKHYPGAWRQYGRFTAPSRAGASIVWSLREVLLRRARKSGQHRQREVVYFHSYKMVLETNKNSLLSHVEDRKRRPACSAMAPPPPVPVICVESPVWHRHRTQQAVRISL